MAAGLRRGYRGVLAALCVLAVLAGCGSLPAGVDGDLTNNWPAFGDAVVAIPVAGTCYDTPFNTSWYGDFESRVVDCAKVHMIETIFVGTFTGALGDAENPPPFANGQRAPAFSDCSRRAEEYLGGQWQTAYLELGLTTPSLAAWHGGARWYTCNLVPLARNAEENETSMAGVAKDGLRGKRPLARTCMIEERSSSSGHPVTRRDAVDCAQPHNSEFAGLYTLHGSFPTDPTIRRDEELAACSAVFAKFLGAAYGDSRYFGLSWHHISQAEWDQGVRTSFCAVVGYGSADYPNKIRYTGSVKGLGTRKPTGWTGG